MIELLEKALPFLAMLPLLLLIFFTSIGRLIVGAVLFAVVVMVLFQGFIWGLSQVFQ